MPHHDQGPGSSVPIDGLNRGVQSRKRAPFWGRFEGRFEPQASSIIDGPKRLGSMYRSNGTFRGPLSATQTEF